MLWVELVKEGKLVIKTHYISTHEASLDIANTKERWS
jgi:hypothetical protein